MYKNTSISFLFFHSKPDSYQPRYDLASFIYVCRRKKKSAARNNRYLIKMRAFFSLKLKNAHYYYRVCKIHGAYDRYILWYDVMRTVFYFFRIGRCPMSPL